MANMNPLAGVNIARTMKPTAEPHHKSRGMRSQPTHKHKVAHKGRPIAEMPMGHGARASAAGRDTLQSSNKAPKLPGTKEGGRNLLQRVGNGATVVGPRAPAAPGRPISPSSPNPKVGSPNSQKRVGVPGNRSMRGGAKPGGSSRSDKAAGPIRSVR